MNDIDFDEIADLQDEMEELKLDSEEVNDILSQNFACDMDEDELDAELEGLDDEYFMDDLD